MPLRLPKIHLGLQDGTLCTTAGSAVQEAHCQLLPRRQPEQMERAVPLTGSRINGIPVHKDLILLPCGAEEDGGSSLAASMGQENTMASAVRAQLPAAGSAPPQLIFSGAVSPTALE